MVLHLDEFCQINPKYGKFLNYYKKFPVYLHEMSPKDIAACINRNGIRAWYFQQRAVLEYFQWLYKEHNFDIIEKYYELQNLLQDDMYVGFYTLEELKRGIEEGLIKAEDENNQSLPDYSGLKAIFFLEWYGVLPESAVTIQLTDVSDDGTTVHIPAESRTVEIDNKAVAQYFTEYKFKTGFKRLGRKGETPYVQQTFYRNTARKGGEVNVKTIYNIRQRFIRDCEDTRFEKKRVYYAGRYFEMTRAESELGRDFSSADSESCEMVRQIFNNANMSSAVICSTLREYRAYKRGYFAKQG